MRDWPTDPIQQHNRVILALCDDLLAGHRGLNGPRVTAVAEINRQINSTRDGGGEPKAAPGE